MIIRLSALSYHPQTDIFEGEWIIKEDIKNKIGWGKIRIRLSYPPQRDVIESGWIILEDRMIGLFSLCSSRDGVDGAQNHITQVHQSTQVHKNTTCAPSPTGYTRLPDLNLSWFHDPTVYFPSLFLILEIPTHIWLVPDIFEKEFKSIKENALKGIFLFRGRSRPTVGYLSAYWCKTKWCMIDLMRCAHVKAIDDNLKVFGVLASSLKGSI